MATSGGDIFYVPENPKGFSSSTLIDGGSGLDTHLRHRPGGARKQPLRRANRDGRHAGSRTPFA